MDFIECVYCRSNLMTLMNVTLKHDEYHKRSMEIEQKYITVSDPQAVKCSMRCFNCKKESDMIMSQKRGCVTIEQIGDKTKKRNVIIGV